MNAPDKIQPQAAEATGVGSSILDDLLAKDYNPTPGQVGMLDLMQDDLFDKAWRIAEVMASGKATVPQHLRGNTGDCLAVCMQALQWNMNPFAVAQKTHIVNGALGYEAQLVNAVVQQSGAIRGRFYYEFDDKGPACRVGAILRGEREITWGEWLSAASVKVKNSPLWATNPKQQLGYLQVKNWARAYCPGAILGVYSDDELGAGDPPLVTADPALVKRGPQRKSEQRPPADKPADHQPTDEQGPSDDQPANTESSGQPASGDAAPLINAGQVKYLQAKIKAAGVEESSILARFEIGALAELDTVQFDLLKSELLGMS